MNSKYIIHSKYIIQSKSLIKKFTTWCSYQRRVTDYSFCQFLLYMGFNMAQFAVPLKFWFELNRLKNDEWFILTDEIMDLIGYKSSASNSTHNRASLLRFIRKHYIEGTDFMVAPICVAKNTRGGAHHKMEIKMKKHAFKSMLMSVRTEVSRTVHEYLITLEEATMKYMNYQYHCQIVATNRANTILEETQEELSKYTYEPVDDSLSRIIAYRPDTLFPAMSTLSPKSKRARRQALQAETKANYFCVFKAKQHLKEHGLDSSSSDTDSNNDCESDHDSFT